MSNNLGAKTAKGLGFKLLERGSVQIVSLVISILLARLLSPGDYGVVAMATIVIELINVFVNYGLSSAIIQNKDSNETDHSTCFWASLILGIVLYVIVFFLAYPISLYFEMPLLTDIIRVLGIQIVFTLMNSVLVAIVAKTFKYRLLFIVTLISSILSGVTGVILAYLGKGVWSLVIQSVISIILSTSILGIVLRWRPKFVFSWSSLIKQISFSWKLLIVGFVDCIYAELRSLIIAKKYTSNDLAYYNKGAQFPKLISNTVNQSIISVLFPSIAIIREDINTVKAFVRKTITVLTLILFPVLFGLAAVSEGFVRVLLTDKWLPCVPFLQILCIAYLVTPLQSVHKQALKAIGKTRTLLVLNLTEKAAGIGLLILAIPFGVEMICWSFVAYHIVGIVIYMIFSHIILGYKMWEQIIDIIPSAAMSALMLLAVVICDKLVTIDLLLELIILVVVGVITYSILVMVVPNELGKIVKKKIFQRKLDNQKEI